MKPPKFKYKLGQVLVRNYPELQIDDNDNSISEDTKWTITRRICEYFYEEDQTGINASKVIRYRISHERYGHIAVSERFLDLKEA
jgi:hypothetical protein